MKALLFEYQEFAVLIVVIVGLFVGATALGIELRQGQPWAFSGQGVREIVAMILR